MSNQTSISQSAASKNFDPNNPYLFTDEEEEENRNTDRIAEEKSYGIIAEKYSNEKSTSQSGTKDNTGKTKHSALFWFGVIIAIIFIIILILILMYVISSTGDDDSDEVTTNEVLLATYT